MMMSSVGRFNVSELPIIVCMHVRMNTFLAIPECIHTQSTQYLPHTVDIHMCLSAQLSNLTHNHPQCFTLDFSCSRHY